MVLSNLLEIIKAQAVGAMGTLQGYALTTFVLLATIDLVVSVVTNLGDTDHLKQIITKILKYGIWLWIIQSWGMLVNAVIDSLSMAGAAMGGMDVGALKDPSSIIEAGFSIVKPIYNSFPESAALLLATPMVNLFKLFAILFAILAFCILAFQAFITYVEFYISSALAVIFIPFGVNKHTSFLAEKAIGSVFSFGVKLMMLAAIMGISWPIITQSVGTIGADSNWDTMLQALTAPWAVVFLAWQAPSMAAGLMSGAPSLSAGTMAGGAMAAFAGGAAVAGGAMAAASGGTSLAGSAAKAVSSLSGAAASGTAGAGGVANSTAGMAKGIGSFAGAKTASSLATSASGADGSSTSAGVSETNNAGEGAQTYQTAGENGGTFSTGSSSSQSSGTSSSGNQSENSSNSSETSGTGANGNASGSAGTSANASRFSTFSTEQFANDMKRAVPPEGAPEGGISARIQSDD